MTLLHFSSYSFVWGEVFKGPVEGRLDRRKHEAIKV
jgi:hypothetical protein